GCGCRRRPRLLPGLVPAFDGRDGREGQHFRDCGQGEDGTGQGKGQRESARPGTEGKGKNRCGDRRGQGAGSPALKLPRKGRGHEAKETRTGPTARRFGPRSLCQGSGELAIVPFSFGPLLRSTGLLIT